MARVNLMKNIVTSRRQPHTPLDNVNTPYNPIRLLKGAPPGCKEGEDLGDTVLPSFDDTKERIPKEIQGRAGTECVLSKWLAA